MDINDFKNRYIVTDTLNEKHGIYLVRDLETGRQYVEKILTVYSADVYRVLFEHPVPNIPGIHDIFESNGVLTVIEDYIYGQNLKEILNAVGRLDEETAVGIMRKLCRVLQKLHSYSPPIVHRDIKPSNIIISPDDEVWLIDLNASKFENSQQSKDTVLIGTEGYAAPEQYGFGSSNPKTDIYAAGILLNEMLTGKLPSVQKAGGPLGEVIDKCTRLDPSERYGSAAELTVALNKIKIPKGKPVTGKDHPYHRWLPPGFRSGHVWKMILAVLGYGLLFLTGLSLRVDNAGPPKLWANRIAYIFIGLAMIFYFSNYGSIWRIFELTRVKWTWLKIILIILAGASIFFILMLIFAVVNQSL